LKRVRVIARSAYLLLHVRPRRSVCPACVSTVSTGRISLKFDIGDFYENFSILREDRAKISGSLHEGLSTFYCCRRR